MVAIDWEKKEGGGHGEPGRSRSMNSHWSDNGFERRKPTQWGLSSVRVGLLSTGQLKCIEHGIKSGIKSGIRKQAGGHITIVLFCEIMGKGASFNEKKERVISGSQIAV